MDDTSQGQRDRSQNIKQSKRIDVTQLEGSGKCYQMGFLVSLRTLKLCQTVCFLPQCKQDLRNDIYTLNTRLIDGCALGANT